MASAVKNTVSEPEFRHDLAPNQVVAIKSILAGDSFRDAALKAGVSERTILRWRTTDQFFEATLRRSVEELREAVCMRAVIAAEKALETLVTIAGDTTDPRALQAARHLLAIANISAPANPRMTLEEVSVDQLIGYT